MAAHIRHEARMSPEAFARWLSLFRETTEELLPPPAAAAFQDRAARIAESLQLGLHFHRERVAAAA